LEGVVGERVRGGGGGGALVFFFVYLGEFNCVWRTRINWGYILW
jgi:hypothetical protein